MTMLSRFTEDQIRSLKELIDASWKPQGNCWEWTGVRNGGGYGTLKGHLAHRLSYALFRRDFRKVQFICHHCDNPACINPDHLYEGDYRTNARDKVQRGRVKTNPLVRF